MGAALSQFFPSAPTLTEKNLPSQKGKVFVITGGTSGVGHQLSKILYNAGGTVIITGRSSSSLAAAIKDVESTSTASKGTISGIEIDLADLTTIKPAAGELLQKAPAIDVLFLNAGVSQPPAGRVTAQGHELQMGVNCLGHHLLASLLLPGLVATSQKAAERNDAPGSVRIVWTSSQVVDLNAPKGGIKMESVTTPPKDQVANYVNSKLGNWYLAHYFSTLPQVKDNAILSITLNPGNLKTNLLRDAKVMYYAAYLLLYPAKMGSYTELWAGLSTELGLGDQGGYIIPWGKKHPNPRKDLLDTMDSKATEFAAWCDDQIREFR
ncbi:NAD(P)-binding protein [Melanomma pulvis-pyrius CBS 109.77]|uniref:NAD(P)-binding protein n=1 Tax=Melanomma pulvis-pyrius CBS 109.77 TaxID=1314802 RepID=A0A6A6WWI6_9PLEO|nr:NAD(P)-binding protein [Melanomma pulvis-pyrius CBS 109.77]